MGNFILIIADIVVIIIISVVSRHHLSLSILNNRLFFFVCIYIKLHFIVYNSFGLFSAPVIESQNGLGQKGH